MSDTATSILTQDSGAGGEPSNAGAANAPWYGELIGKETDADFQAFAKNKNYPDPLAAIKGHYNAEKLIGLDRAGRTVVLPKDENDQEGLKAFRSKLGVPEKPEDYKLKFGGTDDSLAKEAAKWFHANGVPPKAAEGIAGEWNKFIEAHLANEEKERTAKQDQELNLLKAELGNAFTTQEELSRRAFRAFGKEAGITGDELTEIEDVIGTAKTLKLFMRMGDMLREADFAGGDKNSMPPDAIRNKIKEIQTKRTANEYTEQEWQATYMPEVIRLQEMLDKG